MVFVSRVATLLLILASCVPHSPSKAPVPDPVSTARDSVPFSGAVDTEESLWPDPLIRTHVRLSSLQHLIEEHGRMRGRLPASIEEILPAGEGPVVLEIDAWGHEIRYVVLGDGDYEVRAPGPDGLLNTADDAFARRGTELPLRRSRPSSRTVTITESLASLLIEHRRRGGSFPETLDDLAASGLRPYLGTTDEWGNPIQYVRRGNRFELRSAGPDGTMGTNDDVVVNDSSGQQ